MIPDVKHADVVLDGLDGSNPLAFLAALGTLRAAPEGSRLGWRENLRPFLQMDNPEAPTDLCKRLAATLRHAKTILNHYPSEIIKTTVEGFSGFIRNSDGDPLTLAFAAAFGSDGVREDSDDALISPTRLSLANGNGGKKLLLQFRQMVDSAPDEPPQSPQAKRKRRTEEAVTLAQLVEEAIFQWKPRDGDRYYAFRWDPAELRRYAHMANRPEDDKYRPVPGANLLAALGLTLLPSAPTQDGLKTTCLFKHQGRELFAWPLWDVPLTLDQVMSLLAHPDPADDGDFAPGWNPHIGVFARFAVERYSDAQKNAYFNTSFAI